jgi:hypothetical protein
VDTLLRSLRSPDPTRRVPRNRRRTGCDLRDLLPHRSRTVDTRLHSHRKDDAGTPRHRVKWDVSPHDAIEVGEFFLPRMFSGPGRTGARPRGRDHHQQSGKLGVSEHVARQQQTLSGAAQPLDAVGRDQRESKATPVRYSRDEPARIFLWVARAPTVGAPQQRTLGPHRAALPPFGHERPQKLSLPQHSASPRPWPNFCGRAKCARGKN